MTGTAAPLQGRVKDELLLNIEKLKKKSIGYPVNLDFNYEELAPFLNHHLNNIGDPFGDSTYQINSHKQEREILDYFTELYHLPKGDEWGYVTNGGTEGNMCGLFLARETYPKGILYFSEESHYSIYKIAKVLRMEYVVIRTEDDGTMDLEDLDQKVRERPSSPVIINVNIGTTMKGAVDSIDGIMNVIRINNISNFYLHCDAALFGMMVPFMKDGPELSFEKPIGSIAVSGHKFIGSPIPSGILIARKVLADRVARPVEYVHILDTTISGSRSGFGTLILWNALKKRKRRFADEVYGCLERAAWLEQELKKCNIPCFKNPHSNIVVLKKPKKETQEKWGLACQYEWAHVVVMQHVTQELLEEFIADILAK